MQPPPSPAVALAVQALQRSHPQVSLLDVLDLAMKGRSGSVSAIADSDSPGSDLGQVLAACFDRGMTPDEWRVLTGPTADPVLVAALEDVWRDSVMAGFAHRYGLTMADGRHPSAPDFQVRPMRRRAM